MNTVRAFLIVTTMSFTMVGLSAAAEPAASSTSTNNVAGNWFVRGDFGTLTYALSCFFTTIDQMISGPCISILEPLLRATGRLNDKVMQFKYTTIYNNGKITLNYRGRIQPDGTVKGSIDTGLSKGAFQATPLSALATDQKTPWIFAVAFPDGLQYSVLCVFNSSDGKASGPCAVTQGSTLQAAGKFEGDNVSFDYRTEFQGVPVHVQYAGAVQSDGTLKGTITEGASVGTFTGQRQ